MSETKPKTPKEDDEPKKDIRPTQVMKNLEDQIANMMPSTNNLKRVAVHHLWDDRFRVNIWEYKEDLYNSHITNSFFVQATTDGVVFSNPELVFNGN